MQILRLRPSTDFAQDDIFFMTEENQKLTEEVGKRFDTKSEEMKKHFDARTEEIKRHLDYFAETIRKELKILSDMLFDISRKVDALNNRLESREKTK